MLHATLPLPPAAKPSFGFVRPQAPTPVDADANFSAAPSNAPRQAASTPPGPAPLPDPEGEQAHDRAVAAVVQALDSDSDASAYTAYAIMQRLHARSQATQSSLLREAQAAVYAAQRQEAGHTLDQVLGQNRSATINAAGMATFTLANFSGVFLGFKLDQPFITQIASQANQIAQPFINVADRSWGALGGTHRANLASVQLKDDAIHIQASTRATEALRAAKESDQDKLRQAADFLSNHLQRRAETLDRMAH